MKRTSVAIGAAIERHVTHICSACHDELGDALDCERCPMAPYLTRIVWDAYLILETKWGVNVREPVGTGFASAADARDAAWLALVDATGIAS